MNLWGWHAAELWASFLLTTPDELEHFTTLYLAWSHYAAWVETSCWEGA